MWSLPEPQGRTGVAPKSRHRSLGRLLWEHFHSLLQTHAGADSDAFSAPPDDNSRTSIVREWIFNRKSPAPGLRPLGKANLARSASDVAYLSSATLLCCTLYLLFISFPSVSYLHSDYMV